MKFFSEVEQQVEVLFRAYTVSAGYDNRRTFQVVLCLFYVAFDYFHYIVRISYVLFHIVTDHFSLISRREDFFLHHTFANGCHLRAVFRVHNRSNDVTAKCRTDLIQQVLVSLTFFLVFVVTDFK